MWCNRRGIENRGASNTIRSPGVSCVIGGDLLSTQVGSLKPVLPNTTPFIFNGPIPVRYENTRSKSFAHNAYQTHFVRPKTAQGCPVRQSMDRLNATGNSTTNFDRAFDDTRLTATAPMHNIHRVNVSAPDLTQTTPVKKLYEEYKEHKASKGEVASPLKRDQKITKDSVNLSNTVTFEQDKIKRYWTPAKSVDFKGAKKQPALVDEVPKQTHNIQNTEPINKCEEIEIAKLHTPEKLNMTQEIQLKHDLRRLMMKENHIRQKLDMDISNNYREQNQLREFRYKLQDQKKEREYSLWANEQARINALMRQAQKQVYGDYAKHDLTHFLQRKDETQRTYAKDRSNLKN